MNRRSVQLSLLVCLSCAVFPSIASADTYIQGSIGSNKTFNTLESPYVITSQVTVDPGVTLTIDPGVVVKYTQNGFLLVNGNLDIRGTQNNPVYFTSFADDEIGGDTGHDGQTPIQSWSGVVINSGGNAHISSLITKYGGSFGQETGQIQNIGGVVTIEDSHFLYGKGWNSLFSGAGTTTIINSEFASSSQIGIGVNGGAVTIAQTNFHNNIGAPLWIKDGVVDLKDSSFTYNNGDLIFVNYPATFTHSNNQIAYNNRGGITVTGNVHAYTIWNNDNNIPYLPYNFTVDAEGSLVVDSGVIIKMYQNNGLIKVAGQLMVNGAAEKPVHITSYADDAVGGDTNNDGNTTLPAPGDWQLITTTSGGSVTLSHTNIAYGGHQGYFYSNWPALGNDDGSINANFVTIRNSTNGFQNNSGSAVITNSLFTNNNTGIYVENGTVSVHNSSFVGNSSAVFVPTLNLPIVDAKNNWWGDTTGPHHYLLNPEGKGQEVGDKVSFTPWLTSDPFVTSTVVNITKPVIIIPGILGSAEVNGKLVLDPILHVYDDFVATFEANGYEEGKTLFPFTYDWRNSNTNSAQLLRLKIKEVKQICNCTKVDVVAHSMGGLVLREYIESTSYQNDVDKIVFIATPHQGSPKGYFAWDGANSGPFDPVQLTVFKMIEQQSKHEGYKNLFDYIQNRPVTSLKELLPIYPYLSDASSPNTLLEYNANNYPINQFLENLENNKQILSQFNILNIIGDTGILTIGKIVTKTSTKLPLWQHGEPINFDSNSGFFYTNGDQTVPYSSATSINSNQQVVLNKNHTDIVDNSSKQSFEFLTGGVPNTVIESPNTSNKKYVFIRLFSPIDVQVVAPDGKRIGKDFITNQDINEIPDAYYSGFNTENEFIVIPNPLEGQYRLTTIGTDNGGNYTVSITKINDQIVSDSDFNAITKPNLQSSVNFNLELSSNNPIAIIPEDTLAPIITITNPKGGDYDHSQVINISATITDEVGVATSTLQFGSVQIHNPGTIDLFYEKLGTTTILATASDFQGNRSTTTLDVRVIATASSTMSDINRLYTLGWIYKKSSRDELIQKLQNILRIQKKIDLITEKNNDKNIIKKVEKIETVIDRILGRLFLLDLKLYQKDKMNDRAYNLIKDDVTWLLNN